MRSSALTPSSLQIDLSTRPDKSVGSDEIWEIAESALKEALDAKGWKYTLNEKDGAFYGELHFRKMSGST